MEFPWYFHGACMTLPQSHDSMVLSWDLYSTFTMPSVSGSTMGVLWEFHGASVYLGDAMEVWDHYDTPMGLGNKHSIRLP